jgi:hypothetical protein
MVAVVESRSERAEKRTVTRTRPSRAYPRLPHPIHVQAHSRRRWSLILVARVVHPPGPAAAAAAFQSAKNHRLLVHDIPDRLRDEEL